MALARHLLIVDTNITTEILDKLRGVLESTERTVQVVHETEAVCLLSLLSAGIFTSVGVVFHGPGIPSWLLDGPMAQAVKRCLTAHGSLDLMECSVRPEDLALSALYALYPDHPVYASADLTGRDGNWTLELLVQDGDRMSLGHTRSLAHLYFTSAAYDLDVQLFHRHFFLDLEEERRILEDTRAAERRAAAALEQAAMTATTDRVTANALQQTKTIAEVQAKMAAAMARMNSMRMRMVRQWPAAAAAAEVTARWSSHRSPSLFLPAEIGNPGKGPKYVQ